MHHYQLFGGVLRSDFEIPELRIIAPTPPDWTLTSSTGPISESADGEVLGSDIVTGDMRVSLYRHGRGLRMVFDDTGSFDISADGRAIAWSRPTGVSEASARADLTGRVLAAALHLAGSLCLHGSAVVSAGEAIGFVAPKFHGKSTLALALTRAGAQLLTDDTLPVIPGPRATAGPGLHAARLWPDSAARVGLGDESGAADGKQLFSALPDTAVTHDSFPLTAVYRLAPTRETRVRHAAERTLLSPAESAMVLIGHAKLAPLLGRSEAPVLFRQAAALAATVPVYRLSVVRDLDRLDEVVATIRGWHTGSCAVAAS